jgi:hypothetical protein
MGAYAPIHESVSNLNVIPKVSDKNENELQRLVLRISQLSYGKS